MNEGKIIIMERGDYKTAKRSPDKKKKKKKQKKKNREKRTGRELQSLEKIHNTPVAISLPSTVGS